MYNFKEWLKKKELGEGITVNTQSLSNAIAQLLGGPPTGNSPGALGKKMLVTPGLASLPVMMAQDPAVQDALAKYNAQAQNNKNPAPANVNTAIPVTGSLPGR